MGSALPLPLPLMFEGPASAADIWWCPLAPPLVAETIPCGRRGTGVASKGPALLLAAAEGARSWATLRGTVGGMPPTGGGGAAKLGAAVAACDGGGLQYCPEHSGFTVPKRFSWCSGRDIRRKQEGSAGSLGFGAGFGFGTGLPLERRAGKRIGT